MCPTVCSKSPVPVGGADEPPGPEELQRSKVQYVTVIMSSADLYSVLFSVNLCLSLVCSFLFIRIQQQEASGSGGGAQTHALPPTGRRTQDQPIKCVQ